MVVRVSSEVPYFAPKPKIHACPFISPSPKCSCHSWESNAHPPAQPWNTSGAKLPQYILSTSWTTWMDTLNLSRLVSCTVESWARPQRSPSTLFFVSYCHAILSLLIYGCSFFTWCSYCDQEPNLCPHALLRQHKIPTFPFGKTSLGWVYSSMRALPIR